MHNGKERILKTDLYSIAKYCTFVALMAENPLHSVECNAS